MDFCLACVILELPTDLLLAQFVDYENSAAAAIPKN